MQWQAQQAPPLTIQVVGWHAVPLARLCNRRQRPALHKWWAAVMFSSLQQCSALAQQGWSCSSCSMANLAGRDRYSQGTEQLSRLQAEHRALACRGSLPAPSVKPYTGWNR